MIVLLNKPYGVLCQFTDREGRPTLADFVRQPGVYAAGRLDADSEGLLVLTDDGPLPIDVPRDRDGTFEPRLIAKHERRFTGFDDKILALYARGMTVREIQAFLAEMYAVEVSPDLISTVTDAVLEEVTAWQARPLEPMYPVVFFDALRVKIRDEATVRSKAIYLALAVLPDGSRDILGLWHWGNTAMSFVWDGSQVVVTGLQSGLESYRFALRDGVLVGTSGYHHGETLEVVRNDDGTVSHLVCATFVYTRVPYDPDAPIPGGPPA